MAVTVSLSEDDLYRLSMALHQTLAYWEKMRESAPATAPIVAAKYQAVSAKIRQAYQLCVTEARQ